MEKLPLEYKLEISTEVSKNPLDPFGGNSPCKGPEVWRLVWLGRE